MRTVIVPEPKDLRPTRDGFRLGSVVAMTNDTIHILSEPDCWNLLSSTPLGRLVTTVGGSTEIFPVNFVVKDRSVLFRTAQGTKLVSAAINHAVIFEADSYDQDQGWSVIVRGEARMLHSREDIEAAEQAGLKSWTSHDKEHFIQIRPTSVTGRRFLFLCNDILA